MDEDFKQILEILNYDYESTHAISKKLGINWYRVETLLGKLETLGFVECLKLNKRTCWRKKNEKS